METKPATESKAVDTDAISCVIQEVQHQLRALVYLARTDGVEEASDGETLKILCEHICMRAHVMLDECLKKMGEGYAGNFQDSFEELEERQEVAREYHGERMLAFADRVAKDPEAKKIWDGPAPTTKRAALALIKKLRKIEGKYAR